MECVCLSTQVAPVVGDLAAERKNNLDILASVTKKKAVLDKEKAANQHIAMEQKRSDIDIDCPLK